MIADLLLALGLLATVGGIVIWDAYGLGDDDE